MSQEEFADRCGLDRTYFGGIERGERNVAPLYIERIATALRITIEELFHGVSGGLPKVNYENASFSRLPLETRNRGIFQPNISFSDHRRLSKR